MSNPFKYTGEVYDDETGLYYLSARYYDPSIGRFINEDTYEGQVNDPLTLNQYVYTANNPTRYTDPSGHWFLDALFLVADVVQFVKNPSWENAAWIAADVLSFADPSGVASATAHAVKALKTAKTVVKEAKVVTAEVKAVKNTQLELNKANGDAYEKQVLSHTPNTHSNVQQQITVKTRVDIVATNKQTGKIECVECKASSTAPLTKNQKAAFPEIAQSGATVVGKGKAPYTTGTQIPPTQVKVKRKP